MTECMERIVEQDVLSPLVDECETVEQPTTLHEMYVETKISTQVHFRNERHTAEVERNRAKGIIAWQRVSLIR